MSLYLGEKKVGTNNTVVKEVPKEKFGATIDDMLGEVNEKGEYVPPSAPWHFDGSAIKKIQNYGLSYAFSFRKAKSVDLSNLEWVGAAGLMNTFHTNDISGHLDLSKLEYVGSSGLAAAFYDNDITSVDLGNLKQVLGDSLRSAFYSNKVAMVDLSNLATVPAGAINTMFYGNTPENGRVDVYLPADGSGWAAGALSATVWDKSTTITEIHFSAHSEAWVQNQAGYASRFGATNADIYFDLE